MPRLDRWLPFIWMGSIPPKLFLLKSKRIRFELILLDNDGILPSRLLFETEKNIKFAHKPKSSNSFGIIPIRLFLFNHKYCKDEQFPRDGEMGPVRLFTPKSSISKSFKNPNSLGI